MTEKRFTDVWCSETGHIGVTDNGVDKEFTGSEFEEWLNALHEENGDLKHYVEFLSSKIERLKVKLDRERNSNRLQQEKWEKEALQKIDEKNEIIRTLGIGIVKIKKAIQEDKEAHALVLCLEVLKKLEEEGYFD